MREPERWHLDLFFGPLKGDGCVLVGMDGIVKLLCRLVLLFHKLGCFLKTMAIISYRISELTAKQTFSALLAPFSRLLSFFSTFLRSFSKALRRV